VHFKKSIRSTVEVYPDLLQMEIVFGLFSMNPVMIIGRDVLGVGPEGLGGLLAAPAFGAVAGSAGLLILEQARRQGRFVILSTLAYCAALVAFTFSSSYAHLVL
jgi:hypothetical protein